MLPKTIIIGIDFSQQEFLVKNELVFNDINDFEIVCQSEEDRELLTSLIGNENSDIFKNIIIDRSYYNNEIHVLMFISLMMK